MEGINHGLRSEAFRKIFYCRTNGSKQARDPKDIGAPTGNSTPGWKTDAIPRSGFPSVPLI